jgi:hypothetical protein
MKEWGRIDGASGREKREEKIRLEERRSYICLH